MADLSYLDTISNKELHKKCLEYGLPNIPVADSSRQVILKRLKSAILGVPVNKKATAAKKTPRRKTIHGSKVTPSPAAAAIETSNVKRTANRNSNNSISSRRTIGTVPSFDNSETSSVRTVHTTTTVSDVDSQSEEDDNYNSIYRQNEQYSQIKQTAPRRSVSLSKSGVLTTSYTREVDPLEQEPRDSDIDAPQSHTYERPRAAAAHMLPSYEPAIERSTYRPRYAGHPKIQPLAQTQLNSTSYFDDGGYELPEHNVPRNTFSGSSAPFGHGSTLGSSIRQRQTGGSSNLGGSIARGALLLPTTKIRGLYSQPETTKPNTLYPELNEFYDNRNPDTVEPMDTDSDSDGYDTTAQRTTFEKPYSKNYSQKLSNARRSPLARPQLRPTIIPGEQESLVDQFRRVFNSLDRQYHLKLYLFIALTVILLTFIYVLFSPST